MKEMNKIYQHMGDSLSKELYGYRVFYNATQDDMWLKKSLTQPAKEENFLPDCMRIRIQKNHIWNRGLGKGAGRYITD